MDKKDFYHEKIQNDPSIRLFILPVERKLQQLMKVPIKLTELRDISSERTRIAHVELRSLYHQRLFIDECQRTNFPDGYEHTALIKEMIHHIAALDLDRANTKLKVFRY
jgi:hypothetical protein